LLALLSTLSPTGTGAIPPVSTPSALNRRNQAASSTGSTCPSSSDAGAFSRSTLECDDMAKQVMVEGKEGEVVIQKKE